MEQALTVIVGFLGPAIVVCIIGIIYGIYLKKKERVQER